MKNIVFKKTNDAANKTKTLSMTQKFEDHECKTQIRKSFLYKVSHAESVVEQPDQPQIHITKSFDTKKRCEKFNFQVNGSFYMTHHRSNVKVTFHHSLDIQIVWKSKIFSPKKSAVLTD